MGKKTTPKKKPKKTTPKKKPASKFAMAGNGKANCGKLKPVATEKACRASAKVIKKQFGSAGAFGSYPKGCFVYNNKLYFNNGKTGKANSKSNPVCVAKATGGKKTTPKKKPANPCAKNNGGGAKARKCMNVKGKAMCGKCPKGYTNSGTKQCKKATATKKPATKLVLAGKGKANCAGKGAAVKGLNGCKAAAKSMKKTFGTVTNARYPKGCFFLNNKVYFNPGKTGRGHGAASPVCVAKAGATKKPAKKLVLAANGKATCAGKGAAVKNESACKAAAKAMKKKFASSGAYASLPKGCFLLNNQFYYNKGKTGKGNSKARAVCVSGATGGKKPAPKFATAGNGKANCGKLKPVATEKACRASANVIAGKGQIQFGSAGAFGAFPKGCFVYSNKLYFNKGKTGKANSKANPVCVAKATGGKKTTPKKKPKKTTPKKKPAPKFAMAGNGKANCGKLKAVATEKACRASAKVIKKQFGSAGAFGSYPKGCFVYNNKLYF